MPQVFRSLPPLDLVERVIQTFGLTHSHDTTWFSKTSLNIQALESLLPELEPYYVPCKAKEFIHSPLTQARGLTILRHVCKAHAIPLTASERTCAGVKGMWYQLTPTSSTPELTISFT